MQRRERYRVTGWLLPLALLCAAAPAPAHLLVRGIPLSELAASSPLAVIGVVRETGRDRGRAATTLAVERAVLGAVAAETLSFSDASHHPPGYAIGQRVLVFLDTPGPPFASRQTSLDAVVLPALPGAARALVSAVEAWAGLREVARAGERVARLQALALDLLESPSARVRREALLDLLAIGGRARLETDEVARVASLARRPETARTLAPGLVTLLAAVDSAESAAALVSLLENAPHPQARALAAHAVGQRRDRRGVPALTRALADPELAVRLSARRALDAIGVDAIPDADAPISNGRES